jgi:flagellar biosynthesis protein
MQGRKTAVALKYDVEENKAPEILAMGEGWVAEKIVEIAEAHNVPVQENKHLAESLAVLDCGIEIPEELYELVAECLWFVHRLDEKWQEKVLKKASSNAPSARLKNGGAG